MKSTCFQMACSLKLVNVTFTVLLVTACVQMTWVENDASAISVLPTVEIWIEVRIVGRYVVY